MSDDYIIRIKRFLGHHGIETYRFEQRRKHRAVVVTHERKAHTAIFPSTGSDWRGPRNAVAGLRRALTDLKRASAARKGRSHER